MPQPCKLVRATVTLAAATSQNFLSQDAARVYLAIQNNGANACTLVPENATVTDGVGWELQAGEAFEWFDNVPVNAFSAISTGGTTLEVWRA